jgi:hypothetical protein
MEFPRLARHDLVTKGKSLLSSTPISPVSPHCVSPALRISCVLPTTSVLIPTLSSNRLGDISRDNPSMDGSKSTAIKNRVVCIPRVFRWPPAAVLTGRVEPAIRVVNAT